MGKLLLDKKGRERMALDKDMIIPEHVALILDGNGRWAKKRGLPRTLGHKEGCVTVEKTVEIAARMGIRYLTVYGFSTENWKRSAEEVGALMQLFRYYMVRLLKIASANNVRVKMIGDRSRFDRDIIDGINRLESETQDNTGLTFVIAVNYGGRDEIRRAAAGLARDCALGKADPDQVDEALFASYLDTAGPGPFNPHKRGAAAVQLPAVAAGLHGNRGDGLSLAGFQSGGIRKSHCAV